MNISKYREYLVINNDKNNYSASICTGDNLHREMTHNTCEVSEIHDYEIYTKNPDDLSVGGWDIVHVRSTDKLIKYYPLFDCIISKNDSARHTCENFCDLDAWLTYIRN